jgi:hypothetical protein
MTGGAYSLSSLYSAQHFALTEGAPVRGGMKSGPNHQFCPECMSWMFTTAEELEGLVNVRSTMFDDAREHKPYVEMARSEGLPGAASGAARSYDGFPQENEFPELLAQYADWDGRVNE